MTDFFLTDDYSLRISNFWNVTFDYVGIDTTTQQNVTVQRIDPTATLYQSFNITSDAAGNFTKYGDVTSLLLVEDNKFVIGKQGTQFLSSSQPLTSGPFPKAWKEIISSLFLFGSNRVEIGDPYLGLQ